MAPYSEDMVLPFFGRHTIFLTGCTGGLGGCVLFKLARTVRVAKIYALVRQDAETTHQKLKANMGTKADDIASTGKVVFLRGDTTKPRLGLSIKDYLAIQKSVSVIINASANINFRDPLERLAASNCFAALELAALGAGLPQLRCLVHISTAYANSFLDDGVVKEEVYAFGCPESEALQILEGHVPPRSQDYAWPYAYTKHLAEQLLVRRFPRLPLLIVRPTSIGPALQEPFPQYMPRKSCPISNLYARLLIPTGGLNTWHVPEGVRSGSNIVDEIPVDMVANMLLQHVYRGTKGVVHAASGLYIPRTLDDFISDVVCQAPEAWRARMATNVFTSDRSRKQCKVADFYGVLTRNQQYCTLRSVGLDPCGPLGLSIEEHDADAYVRDRVARVMEGLYMHNRQGDSAPKSSTLKERL